MVVAELRAGFAVGRGGNETAGIFEQFLHRPRVDLLIPTLETTRHYVTLFEQLHSTDTYGKGRAGFRGCAAWRKIPFNAILQHRGEAMGFYDSPENVEQYVNMADGHDGRTLVEEMRRYLEPGSYVLEIGMGPGIDLDLLRTYFNVTGSDASDVFIQRYLATHPGASLLELDAVTLDTDRRFDGIFSNKVLHHLNPTDQEASFQRQTAILNSGGYAFHSFWYGNNVEEFEGLLFHQHTEDSLRSLVEEHFDMVELRRYTEMETDDSLFAVLKRRSPL